MAQTESHIENKETPEDEKKKRPLWKRFLWAITHLSLGTLALILLIFALLYFLLFTHLGLKGITWGAETFVPELKIEKVEGALLTDFRLHNVKYINPDLFIDFQADTVEFDLKLRCLSQLQLCVDSLGIGNAKFSLTDIVMSETSQTEEKSEPIRSISIPFGAGVKIERIYLDNVDTNILGHKIRWRKFETGAQMRFDNLTLAPTHFDGGRVELAPLEENQSSNSKIDSNTPLSLPEVWIPLNIDIQDITVTDFKLSNPDVQIDKVNLVGSAQGHNVNINHVALMMPEVNLKLDGRTELKGDYPLELNAHGQIKQTQAADQSFSLKAQGSVADLAVQGTLRDLIIADINAKIQPLDPKLPFDIDLAKAQAQWPLNGKADYKAQISSFKALGTLEDFSLTLMASAQGESIPDVDMSVEGQGNLEQLSLSDIEIKSLGGEVKGKVLANWAKLPFWEAVLDLDKIQPGTYWSDVEGDISGHIETSGRLTQTGGWEVELPQMDIDGIVRDYPLNINGSLETKDVEGDGQLQFETSGLVIAHGQNRVRFSGSLHQQWNLDAKIDIPELEHTLPEAEGVIIGSIGLRGEQNTPEIKLDINANDVVWLNHQLALESATLKGSVEPLPSPKGDVALSVSQLTYQGKKVIQSELSFKGSEKDHQINFSIDSEVVKGILSIEGGAKQEPHLVWQGKLNRTQFTTTQGTWNLDHPPEISFDTNKNQAFVQAHCWLQAQSRLCLDEDVIAGESGEILASINDFDLSQIQFLLPEDIALKGRLNAKARAKWSPQTLPEVDLQTKLSSGSATQQLDIPLVIGWDEVVLNANLAKDNLKANWSIELSNNGGLTGNLALDNVSKQNKRIDAGLQIESITLTMLEPLFGEFSQVDANINGDIQMKGDALHPQILGDLKVDKIVAKGEVTPIEVESGDIAVRFSGYNAVLDSDLVTKEGDLKLTGDANWRSLDNWHTNLNLNADELLVEQLPEVRTKVSPNLSMSITPDLIDVKGEVKLPWARIEVKELPPSAISVSSDEVVLNKELQPITESGDFPFKLRSNINVIIGKDFRLSAFGLKSRLAGDLHVSQKNNAPFILGEVHVVDGSYRSFGQDLIIEEGKVQFNGPADQPYLTIKAIRNPDSTEDDVTAGIRVIGPADEPSIEVFSEPSLPQANALSYMLRGRDIDSESGGNGMTTALIGLSLARSGRLVGEIGEAFGVSDLQLDTEGTGDDSQVTVSGYILPGLQLKYGVGIFESIGEFTFRYRVMKDLYLEVMSGTDSAVDLLYQFEFD